MTGWENIIREAAKKAAARDFVDVDVRRLAGNLHDIHERTGKVMEKLDELRADEESRYVSLEGVRQTVLYDATDIGYQLGMIEQETARSAWRDYGSPVPLSSRGKSPPLGKKSFGNIAVPSSVGP